MRICERNERARSFFQGRSRPAAREMGGYRLLERISQGGMGEIWRAEHRMLARPAAVKLIRPDARFGGGMPEAASRFESEARAIAALRSPHTVAIYDFGAAGGRLYYAMELLDGYDAETLVRRFGPVPPERAAYLIRQVCDSLEEAHRAGMVHRDIKPANLFVCRYGLKLDFVKVLDFGLVTTSGGLTYTGRRTRSDVIAGTPAYLAPEVVLGGEEADWRADIYSLGCVGFWLLTGKPVFDNPGDPFLDPVRTPVVPPSRRSDVPIPKELDELIVACLAKDPKDRPQTALEISDRLASLGLERDWSARRREVWWRDHSPDSQGGAEFGGARLIRRSA